MSSKVVIEELYSSNGTPLADETGLNWSWWEGDETQPLQRAPDQSGVGETTDSNAKLEVDVASDPEKWGTLMLAGGGRYGLYYVKTVSP